MADVTCANLDCAEYGIAKTNPDDHPTDIIACGTCGYAVVAYTGSPPTGFNGGATVDPPPPLGPLDPIPPPDTTPPPPGTTR